MNSYNDVRSEQQSAQIISRDSVTARVEDQLVAASTPSHRHSEGATAMERGNTIVLRRLIAAVIALFTLLASLLLVNATAEAQTLREVSLGATTASNNTVTAVANVKTFSATVSSSEQTVQIQDFKIDVPTQPNVALYALPNAYHRILVNGVNVASGATGANPGITTLTRDPVTGQITIGLNAPITLNPGDTLRVDVRFNGGLTLTATGSTLHAYTAAPEPTTTTPSPTTTATPTPTAVQTSTASPAPSDSAAPTTTAAPAPADSVYSANAVGTIEIGNTVFQKSNPYGVTTTVTKDATFEKAVLRIAAPNSILSPENYQLNISLLEDGASLTYRVLRFSADYIEIEVTPLLNGQPVSSVKIPAGSQISTSGSLGGTQTVDKYELNVYGNLTSHTVEPARLDQILVPGELSIGQCNDPGYYWVSVKPDNGSIIVNGKTIYGDYAVEYNADGTATGRVLQLTQNFSSDIAVSPDNKTMYAVSLYEPKIQVYDIATGKMTAEYTLNLGASTGQGLNSLSMAPDGKSLYVGIAAYNAQPSPVYQINTDGTGLKQIGTTNGNTNWGGDFITLPDGSTLGAQSDGKLVMWPGAPSGVPTIVGTIRDVEGTTANTRMIRDDGNYVWGLAYVNGSVYFIDGYNKTFSQTTMPPLIGLGKLTVTPSLTDNISVYGYQQVMAGTPPFPGMDNVASNQNRQNWGLTSTGESNPCPPTPPAFVVKKDEVESTATKLPDGTYEAKYTVTVANASNTKGNSGQILDRPFVPAGFELVQVKVDEQVVVPFSGTVAPNHISAAETGSYLVSPGVDLDPKMQQSFSVKLYLRPKADITAENWTNVGTCTDETGGNVSNTGVPNLVSLSGEDNTVWDDNDACVTIKQDQDVKLALEKVDYQNKTSQLTGAEFIIYAADANGDRTNTEVAKMNDTTVENGYYAANLKANTFYYLVETKSPVGFNLLAQPVLFKIITDENGNQQVQFYDPATKQIKQNGGALAGYFKKDGAESTSVAYVQVADVRQTGTLPRTGGNGIGAPVLAALVIFAAAGIFMRRRA